jgi:GTPase SAR1 family protein
MRPKVKVVVVIESRAGKICICHRSALARAVGTTLPTLRGQAGTEITFDISDTTGQEEYNKFAPMHSRHAGGALVTFDPTGLRSFTGLDG